MLNFLKSFFKKIYQNSQTNKVNKIIAKTEKPNTLNWGFVVPHEKKAQGASLYDKSMTEYVYWQVVYHWFVSKFKNVPFSYRDSGGLSAAYKELKKNNCNASLEWHYNAFNGEANGYCVLVLKGDSLSAEYAELLLNVLSRRFPNRKNRGIKYVSSGTNGALNLIRAKENGMKIALLPEPFFGDVKSEFVNEELMADIINEFIEKSYLL